MGVASWILQRKHFLYVWKPKSMPGSETHRFRYVVNPSKRGGKSFISKIKDTWFPLSHWENSNSSLFHIWENPFYSHLQIMLQKLSWLFESSISSLNIISMIFQASRSRNDSWLLAKLSYSVHSFLHSKTLDRQWSNFSKTQWSHSQRASMSTILEHAKSMMKCIQRLKNDQHLKYHLMIFSENERRPQNEASSLRNTREKSLNLSRERMLRRMLKQLESLALQQHLQSERQRRNNHCTRPFRAISRDGRMESLSFHFPHYVNNSNCQMKARQDRAWKSWSFRSRRTQQKMNRKKRIL